MNPTVKSVNILLIEDSPDYASLVLHWVSKVPNAGEFKLVWTDSLAAALARLEQGDIDLILMDLGLPDSDGLATFLALRSRNSDLPIIVLSGSDSEALALQTIQQGAQDYLVKSSCTADLLLRTVRHAVVRHGSVSHQARTGASAKHGRIIGILGGSGGVGATTAACVLAAELRHHTDQPTLLMDMDLNSGLVGFTMGIDAQYSLKDAVENADRLDQSIWDGLITQRPGSLDILTASTTIESDNMDARGLGKVLSFAETHYRWIVMDLGRLNPTSARLLRSAGDIFLVSTQSIPALHQCKRTVERIHDLGINHEQIRLILNQTSAEENMSGKDIENLFGVQIGATLPPAHEELCNAYLKKRLPSVTSGFRVALTGIARKLADLPPEQVKRPLLSLASLRNRFQPKSKADQDSIAS
jgi:Flp pilus assembly CpaE family ATPase